MNLINKTKIHLGLLVILIATTGLLQAQSSKDVENVNLKIIGSTEKSFYVISTIIYGKTEAILFDGMYRNSDGQRVADEVEKLGVKLKALILSHVDHDHYMGATEIINRFPGTPVYITQAVLDDFASRSESDYMYEKKRGDASEVPSELIKPQLLPAGPITVDGYPIEIIPDLTGDVQRPASIALWIASTKTILSGDIAFDGMHPWLGNSDPESRKRWIKSLEVLATYQPEFVIPGHKVDLSSPNSPAVINHMIEYLNYYNSAMVESASPEEVVNKMKARYPDLKLAGLMSYGVKKWFNR